MLLARLQTSTTRVPATNPEFWADKRVRNMARDMDTNQRLEAAGWTVLRFWEHESAESIAAKIAEQYTTLRAEKLDGRTSTHE